MAGKIERAELPGTRDREKRGVEKYGETEREENEEHQRGVGLRKRIH